MRATPTREPPPGVIPIYLPEHVFVALRDLADREGTSPQFLAINLLTAALGLDEDDDPPDPRWGSPGVHPRPY
jgi:hypothetical protein